MKQLYFIFLLCIGPIATAQTLYKNVSFNFEVQIPSGWSKESIGDSKGGKKLTEAERTRKLKDEKSVYLVSYSKRSILSMLRVPGPKIQINAVYKPQNDFNSFKKEAIRSAEQLKEHLDNFEFVSEPTEITVGGIKGIWFVTQYTMPIDGKNIAIRCRTYGIPYKDYLLHISMVDMPKQDCSEEFDSIISSLVIGI